MKRDFCERILVVRCSCGHGPAKETYKDEEYEGRCKACKRCICLLCGLTITVDRRVRNFLPHLESHKPAYPPTDKEIEKNNRVANTVCTNTKCKAVGSYGAGQSKCSTRCKMEGCKMAKCNRCGFTNMKEQTVRNHCFRSCKT